MQIKVEKYILLAAVDDRRELLSDCLASLRVFDPSWTLVMVGQKFSQERKLEIEKSVSEGSIFLWQDEAVGMHNAKLIGLSKIRSLSKNHVVASVDDDMIFLPHSNFDRMAEIASMYKMGLISGNWVRSKKSLPKKILKMKDEAKKQAIVYTAGGMVFREWITEEIINLGVNNFWCDNTEWSMASYLAGYHNARYLGSMAVHKILSQGGRKSYVESVQRKLPNPRFVNVRPAKVSGFDGYHIPCSSDITSEAKAERKRRIAGMGG